jgi:AraC-like DNA-binding protein
MPLSIYAANYFDLFQKVIEFVSWLFCNMIESKIIEFKGMPLFQRARFKPPFIMEGEIKDFACFFYMVEGAMVSYDARGKHHISTKEAIMKNCGNYIQEYVAGAENEKCEAIAIYLYPELLQKIYKDEVPNFEQQKGVQQPKKLVGNKLVEQYMNNLSIYFEDEELLDEELGILKLKELVMILLRSENHQNIRKLLSEIFAPVNVKFRQAIEENLFNNLSTEQLSFLCGMSLSTFKREFKKTFNETPARYIKHKRLEHAAKLLCKKDEPISAIAYDCGFQDSTTFSASFHEKYQVSPSQYRLNQTRKNLA